MTLLWPAVCDRLVALIGALPAAEKFNVLNGPPLPNNPALMYATVGHVESEDFAGAVVTAPADDGWCLLETGNVQVEIVAATGSADLSTVRAASFGLADAVLAMLRADQTLGGLLDLSSEVSADLNVQPAQTSVGAVQRLTLIVNYSARSAA